MPNPKTGKPQLEDYLYKGPPKKKKPVDIFNDPIDTLPDREFEPTEDERKELTGDLKWAGKHRTKR
jgi:hypothetical protein